jgi:probable F420-dependent oxidoreductase
VELGRVGIWSGGLRGHEDAGQVREAAAELEELGYSAVFLPGRQGGDELFQRIDDVLASTRHAAVVTGIINVWGDDPRDAAVRFDEVDRDHPGRFQLGLGVGHAAFVDRAEPGRYARPLSKMRHYLDDLGDRVPARRMLIAALAPRMLELARERTAGSHTYFVPVEHTRYAREVLGPDATLAVEQTVLLETDPVRAAEQAREFTAAYLRLPNYVSNLLRLGFTEEDVTGSGSERLVNEIVAWGDEEAIASRIAAHLAAGADHVCVQVLGPGSQAIALDEWRRLAPVARL